MYDKKFFYKASALFTVIVLFLYAKYQLGWFYKGIFTTSIIPPGKWRLHSSGSCSATACGTRGIKSTLYQCYDPKTGLDMDSSNCSNDVKPKGSQDCDTPSCVDWTLGEWSSCPPCGVDVIRTREVSCSAKDPDNGCDQKNIPPTRDRCRIEPCGKWIAPDFPKCPVCGPDSAVLQTRKVTCSTGTACDPDEMPPSENKCEKIRKCNWETSEWDIKCPNCGPPPNVVKNRTIYCETGNDNDCPPENKPYTKETCPRKDCMWKTGDWIADGSTPPPIV